MTRGELARQSGCNIETLRYYEKIHLMADPPRTAAGYRIYDEHHRRRLGFILRGRQLGFSIEELRGLLSLVDRGDYTCADVLDLTTGHLGKVQAKIADLRRLEDTLATIVAGCDGRDVPDCPVIDALFQDEDDP